MTIEGTILSIFLILPVSYLAACRVEPMDSVKQKTEKRSHWRLTARVHTEGIFNFGGRVGSVNPTGDINFTYDRKKWGFLFFKGQDFYDHTTFYNFALATVYKNFKPSPKLTITPSVGSFLEQANSVADRGSDIVFLLTTTFRINQQLSLEQMSLLGNLIIEPTEHDWVNRLRLLYSHRHLDVTTSLWHNNSVFDNSSYWSCGLTIAYSRIKFGEHAYLSTGVSGLLVLQTSDEAANPKKNALMLTVGLQVFN